MSENEMKLVDRLQERGLIDRWGFMTFALVGSLGIIAAKYWLMNTIWIAGGALLFMLLYAILVNLRGSGKLRSDQAGDNCYYLGLIFTLASLAFAIFTFDPANTATTIVQGFGVALATTIFGLILRVFFNQSRVDLYEAEESARLELTAAAAKLKTQLSQVALSFKDFSHGLQQSVGEVRDAATESIQEAAKTSVESVRALADEASRAIAQQSAELNVQAGKLAKTTRSVGERLSEHADSIGALTQSHVTITGNVEKMGHATAKMAESSALILSYAEKASALAASAEAVAGHANTAASTLQGSMDSTVDTMRRFERDFAERLAALENGPKANTDAALLAIANTAKAVEAAMEHMLAQHAAAVEEAEQKTAGFRAAVAEHQTELESDLLRHRERVSEAVRNVVEPITPMIENAEQRAGS